MRLTDHGAGALPNACPNPLVAEARSPYVDLIRLAGMMCAALRGNGAMEYTIATCAIRVRLLCSPGVNRVSRLRTLLVGLAAGIAEIFAPHHDALGVRADDQQVIPPGSACRGAGLVLWRAQTMLRLHRSLA
jgi:hypothetical protein